MPPHGHGDGHSCAHEHEDDGIILGEASSLFRVIARERAYCLNEDPDHPGKDALKPYEDRTDTEKYLLSDADEELIFHIPFNEDVKLKGITIYGGGEDQAPKEMRAFTNREDVDFDSVANFEPTQTWNLSQTSQPNMEYITTAAKFSNLSSLTLYFPTNFGAEHTKIYYIGLRGQHTKAKREAVHTVYESRPLKKEEDIKSEDQAQWGI